MTTAEKEIMEKMKRCWPRLAETIQPECDLEQLGADSLDLVEFLTELDEAYGIRLEIEEFQKLRTVGDLCAHVTEKRQSKEINK